MDQGAGVLPNAVRTSSMWCCAFRLVGGGDKIRDRVFHQKVDPGKEEMFVVNCAKEMHTYLNEHVPQASGKQKSHAGAVVAMFRFSQGKRTGPLSAHQDSQISLAQLLDKDLQVLENAFAIAIATAQ